MSLAEVKPEKGVEPNRFDDGLGGGAKDIEKYRRHVCDFAGGKVDSYDRGILEAANKLPRHFEADTATIRKRRAAVENIAEADKMLVEAAAISVPKMVPLHDRLIADFRTIGELALAVEECRPGVIDAREHPEGQRKRELLSDAKATRTGAILTLQRTAARSIHDDIQRLTQEAAQLSSSADRKEAEFSDCEDELKRLKDLLYSGRLGPAETIEAEKRLAAAKTLRGRFSHWLEHRDNNSGRKRVASMHAEREKLQASLLLPEGMGWSE